MLNRLKIAFCSLSVFALCSCSQPKYINSKFLSAEEVVDTYCKSDESGAQAWSSDWKAKIQPYTDWHVDPKWDQANVIKTYKILNTIENDGMADVTVLYDVLGTLSSAPIGFDFKPGLKQKKVVYSLTKIDGKWKIARPQLEPFISIHTANDLLDKGVLEKKNKVDYDRHMRIKKQIQDLAKY